ncbi:MAG: DUF1579 family protein [Candidatus Aminicenantales bacterium]|jgi:hypothetical protein
MKRFVIAVSVVLLVFAVFAWAQTPAPKPGPEQKKLEIWVGKWTYEGEAKANPLGPAGKYSGMATVRPVLGGFFVEWRAEEKGPSGTTQWFEIDGYDAVNMKFMWNNFSSDGSFETAAYTIEANTVNYSGTHFLGEKQYKFRGSCVFAPDLMSSVSKQEISVDGKTWMPQYESKWTKTKSSPK